MRIERARPIDVLFVCLVALTLLAWPVMVKAGGGCCSKKSAGSAKVTEKKTVAKPEHAGCGHGKGTDSTLVENPGQAHYCSSEEAKGTVSEPDKTEKTDKVTKCDTEWRSQLTPEQYRIAREKGTEAAFTGKYWNTKRKGTYNCVGCGQPLFSSENKFDSGTGWPSFTAPVDSSSVTADTDKSQGMIRSEVLCSRCNAHLGHVFDDGPEPTGMRYCINSAVLDLVEEEPEGDE